MKTETNTNGRPKELEEALERLPSLMGALMREYIQKRNVNDRIQILQRVKALFDFASVDNEFPPNPALDHALPDPAREPARADAMREHVIGAPIMGGLGHVPTAAAPPPMPREERREPDTAVLLQ
jgi:hypothetical protein